MVSTRYTSSPAFQPSVRRRVRGAEVARPDGAQVDAVCLAPPGTPSGCDPISQAASEAADEEGDDHAFLRRMTMRSGLPVKPERLAEAVVQEADVVLLHEVGVVAEHGDRRRRDFHLRGVVELHLEAGRLRRLATGEQFAEAIVDLAGGDARVARAASTSSMRSSTLFTRWPVSADVNRNGMSAQERRLLHDVLAELVGALVVLLGVQVPLVHDDDDAAPRFPGERGDLEVLVVEAVDGVDQQHADVGAVDRPARAQRRRRTRSPRPPSTGGAGRPCPRRSGRGSWYRMGVSIASRVVPDLVGHHEPVLPEQAVDERRLAHVRTPDHGDAQRIGHLLAAPRGCARPRRRAGRPVLVPLRAETGTGSPAPSS